MRSTDGYQGQAMAEHRSNRFPIGAAVTLQALDADPYPVFAALRANEPVSWVPCVNAWFVTRYEDVQAVLGNTQLFATEYPDSLLTQVFGRQLLSVDGALHQRYRAPLQPHFTPQAVRARMTESIELLANRLIATFATDGRVELRAAFANRLPVQTVLSLFGLPLELESQFRHWYDSFEAGLANLERDPDISRRATADVSSFLHRMSQEMDLTMTAGRGGLFQDWLGHPSAAGLGKEELLRNALTVFFGGISTVEALILNTMWVLGGQPDVRDRAAQDSDWLGKVIEEVMRWISPVQSATRRVMHDTVLHDVALAAGDTVSCMLGAANRDPAIFAEPDKFNPERSGLRKHLGFAAGEHFCLGSHLAKLEVALGIRLLLQQLPGIVTDPAADVRVVGYEFRQPRALPMIWELGRD